MAWIEDRLECGMANAAGLMICLGILVPMSRSRSNLPGTPVRGRRVVATAVGKRFHVMKSGDRHLVQREEQGP